MEAILLIWKRPFSWNLSHKNHFLWKFLIEGFYFTVFVSFFSCNDPRKLLDSAKVIQNGVESFFSQEAFQLVDGKFRKAAS